MLIPECGQFHEMLLTNFSLLLLVRHQSQPTTFTFVARGNNFFKTTQLKAAVKLTVMNMIQGINNCESYLVKNSPKRDSVYRCRALLM